MKLADFGLAIEVQGEQQAWFGKLPFSCLLSTRRVAHFVGVCRLVVLERNDIITESMADGQTAIHPESYIFNLVDSRLFAQQHKNMAM